MYLHSAKIAFYAKKKWTFYCPYLKDWQNANVKWKLPSHTFLVLQITFSLAGFGGFSAWEQTASGLLHSWLAVSWSFEGRSRQMGCSAQPCAAVPARRQIFSGTCYLPITRSGEGSLESSRIVEAGRWCYRACWYHSWWHWSPLQYKTLSEEQPFAFCWHLYWEMPFLEAFLHNSVTVCLSQVEGKCLLPTGSRIFDTRNSLHKQRSAWAWSEPAPEEHCCWLILHAPCAKLNI